MLNHELLPVSEGLERIVFVTPAAPGFYVLSQCVDAQGAICGAAQEPVVSWALDSLGCNYPVTLNDGLDQTRNPAILCPDGEVREYDGTWANLADWLDDQKEAKVRHDKLR